MQIGDFKRFKNGVTVIYKHCNIYDVYMIDVDEDRIELSDNMGIISQNVIYITMILGFGISNKNLISPTYTEI